jgi:hypothetical protein
MVARPGHHLHRTLHRNIDWWAVGEVPFDARALQIGKTIWKKHCGKHCKKHCATQCE